MVQHIKNTNMTSGGDGNNVVFLTKAPADAEDMDYYSTTEGGGGGACFIK